MPNQEIITKVLMDETPFTFDGQKKLKEGFLYYGDTKLTDKKCIKNVYVCQNGTLVNSGRVRIYCYGEIKEGDYLTTSELYGTAVSIINKDFAFARATSTLAGRKVGLVDAVIL